MNSHRIMCTFTEPLPHHSQNTLWDPKPDPPKGHAKLHPKLLQLRAWAGLPEATDASYVSRLTPNAPGRPKWSRQGGSKAFQTDHDAQGTTII